MHGTASKVQIFFSSLPQVLERQSVPCDITFFESVTRETVERTTVIIAVKGLLRILQMAVHAFDINTKAVCIV